MTSHPAPTKLIIYDLDGTLLDSFEDIARALNHGLTGCGLPPCPIEDVKRYVGNGIRVLVLRALGERNAGRVDDVLPLCAQFYKAHPADASRLYPGVLETLQALHDRGIIQVILTNKPHAIALESCASFGLNAVVDRVQGESADAPLKPNPEAALRIIREFGVSTGEAVVVGDGKPDIDLARAAGIRAIACSWGTQSRAELEALNPDAIIDRMDELPHALGFSTGD